MFGFGFVITFILKSNVKLKEILKKFHVVAIIFEFLQLSLSF